MIENAQKPDNSNSMRCDTVKKLLVAQILMKLPVYYVCSPKVQHHWFLS
jgi:hypothetical protein